MNDASAGLETPSAISLPVRLFWVAVFLGSAGYFGYQGEWLVAGSIVVTGLSAFSGYRFGAAAMVVSVAGLGLAIWFAPDLGLRGEDKLSQWAGTTGLLNRALCVAIAGILIALGTWVLGRITLVRWVADHFRLDQWNRRVGFLLGAAQGALTVALVLGGAISFAPIHRQQIASQNIAPENRSITSRSLFWLADATQSSPIGPWIETYNPIERVPVLDQMDQVRKTALVVSNPDRINQLINHPAIEKLQRQPSVQQAVFELRSDQRINEILTSGKPLDRTAAMTLLSHPAVMNLVDQPGFLEQAQNAIRASGL